VLGKRVFGWEALLFCLTGMTVSAGVLVVGPVVLFGLLVIPPLAAHAVARSMLGFYGWSAALGALAAVGGLAVSFGLDWPLGPAVCAVAAVELAPAAVARALRPSR